MDAYVVPLYRPDIKGIAYYEFTVVSRSGGGSRWGPLLTQGYSPAREHELWTPRVQAAGETGAEKAEDERVIGFIVATNGRHDFPVPHWSLEQLPPSRQASEQARQDLAGKEAQDGSSVTRLYRLDALSYAAENENGELVAQSGQFPSLISGLPHSLERFAGQIAYALARPLREIPNDDNARDSQHEVERSKDELPNLKWSEEGDWHGYKEQYADLFGPFLDQLRKRAAKTWEVEDLIRKWGEGIMTGTTHRLALLDEAAIELSGEGAKYVEVSIKENPAGPPSLLLSAPPGSLKHEMPFDVLLRYGNGESERLSFFVVSSDVPSNVKAEQALQRQQED